MPEVKAKTHNYALEKRALIHAIHSMVYTGIPTHMTPADFEAYIEAYKVRRIRERPKEEGRLIELPCKVGETVYVITQCKNVAIQRDDDYLTGTGAAECPFESSCDIEDCDDKHTRIFETKVSDFCFGGQNGMQVEMFFEGIESPVPISDIGKTLFLTREAAEAEKER